LFFIERQENKSSSDDELEYLSDVEEIMQLYEKNEERKNKKFI
jgi:hypothetical protein